MVPRPDEDDDSAEAWQTAMAVKATMAAAVTLVSDAAAPPTAARSATNGGPDGDDGSAAIAMQ